jgi:CheY-like chemotaxis protein
MRVLIIDDNPLDIELVSRMLGKRLGATVESAHTGEEGLRRLKVEMFDVVLLDYSLPGQNGLDFLRDLQDLQISTPVLLVTARGDTRIQEEALQAGAVDYISKDESLTPALYRAVEAAAERGRAARAFKERDRAEELRHNAEMVISALEHRIENLESSIGSTPRPAHAPKMETLSAEDKEAVITQLTQTYGQILKLWTGNQADAQKAREALSPLIAELFRLGFNAEQLVSLHTASCHYLRDQKWEGHSQSGCSPRMLLIEAALALLDAYRRAAFAPAR